jgi:hypothetical protein
MIKSGEPLPVRIASQLEESLGNKFEVTLGAFSTADIKITNKQTGYIAFIDVEDIGRNYDVPLSKAAYINRFKEQHSSFGKAKTDFILVSNGNVSNNLRAALNNNAVMILNVDNAVLELTKKIQNRSGEAGINNRHTSRRLGSLKRRTSNPRPNSKRQVLK